MKKFLRERMKPMNKRFLGVLIMISLQIYCGKSPMFPVIDSGYIVEQVQKGDNSLLQANFCASYRRLSTILEQFGNKSAELSSLIEILEKEQTSVSSELVTLVSEQINSLLKEKRKLDLKWAQIKKQFEIIKLKDLASYNG